MLQHLLVATQLRRFIRARAVFVEPDLAAGGIGACAAPGDRAQNLGTRNAGEIELEIKVDPEYIGHPAELVFMLGVVRFGGHVVSSYPLEQHENPLFP